jgi:hypothetical protein
MSSIAPSPQWTFDSNRKKILNRERRVEEGATIHNTLMWNNLDAFSGA